MLHILNLCLTCQTVLCEECLFIKIGLEENMGITCRTFRGHISGE